MCGGGVRGGGVWDDGTTSAGISGACCCWPEIGPEVEGTGLAAECGEGVMVELWLEETVGAGAGTAGGGMGETKDTKGFRNGAAPGAKDW